MPLLKNNFACVLTMTLFAILLTACATPLPPSVVSCPQLPPKPLALQQTPLLPYSASARLKLEDWRKRLTDTLPMPSNAPPPGRSE